MKAKFIVYLPSWRQEGEEFIYVDEVYVYKIINLNFHPFIGMKLNFPLKETNEYIHLTEERTFFKTGFFEIEESLCHFDGSGDVVEVVFRQQALYEWSGCFEDGMYPQIQERDAAVLELIHGFGFRSP